MPGGGGILDFWNGSADVLTWGRPNYLESEILRYQKCYKCSEIWGRPDYLESDISIMSWSIFLVSIFFGT